MCFHLQGIFRLASIAFADANKQATFAGYLRLIAQCLVFLNQIVHRMLGVSGGAIDCQDIFQMMQHIFLMVHHRFAPLLFV
jgi:hypothetical protein